MKQHDGSDTVGSEEIDGRLKWNYKGEQGHWVCGWPDRVTGGQREVIQGRDELERRAGKIARCWGVTMEI